MSGNIDAHEKVDHVVVLVHGIRTFGGWQDRAREYLERDPTIKAYPVRYGYFSLLRLLSPVSYWRNKAARKILAQIRDAQEAHPDSRLSIIAHSFGAYCVCRILLYESNMNARALILCGAIVQDDFPWWLIKHRVQLRTRNDFSRRDPWPAIAGAITIRYKGVGTLGAESPVHVDDCGHTKGHSDYFTPAAFEEWRNLIVSGATKHYAPAPSNDDMTSPGATAFLGILRSLRWILPFALIGMTLWWVIRLHTVDSTAGRWQGRIDWSAEFSNTLINFDGTGGLIPRDLHSSGYLYLSRTGAAHKLAGLARWSLINGTTAISDLCVEIDGVEEDDGSLNLKLVTGIRQLQDRYREPTEKSERISYAPFFDYSIALTRSREGQLEGSIARTIKERQQAIAVGRVVLSRP